MESVYRVVKAGEQLYKFKLIAPLGAGGFGTVWRAQDLSIDRTVALKVLDASFQPVISLLEEARIGNKLKHSNVVPVLYADIVESSGKKYALLAQEFVDGGALTGALNSRNFMPINLVIKYLIDVLSGLEYLHNNGIYHNDIKPSNVLIGEFGQAKLADYGIAGVDITGTQSSIVPKNAYKVHRAPETASSSPVINPQTDVYQAGITGFRLTNGISLIKDDIDRLGEAEFEKRKAAGKIPNTQEYLPFVPQSVKTILNKAFSTDINIRFTSALEMRRRLENLSFPVCWTSDESGQLIGDGAKWIYRFEKSSTGKKEYELECLKENRNSGKVFRIQEYCRKRLSKSEMEKLKKRFFKWTITEGK